MKSAIEALQWITAAGFLLVGLAAAWAWLKSRAPGQGDLALAVGLFGVVSLIGRINDVTDYEYSTLISDFNLAAFMASGLFLLRFRHSYVPIARSWWLLAIGAVTGVTVAAFAMRLPTGPNPTYTTEETILLSALIGVWGICVTEPVIRFWRASRGRPLIQRNRLRALSIAYGSIVVILLIAIAAQPNQYSTGTLIIQVVALGLLPLFYVSIAPPRWLRRAWRQKEEEDLRLNQGLLMYAPDRPTLAQRGLDSAARLVGANAGVLHTSDGRVLAHFGMHEARAETLADEFRALDEGELVPVAGLGYAIAAPIPSEEGTGRLIVFSGPFIRLFGADEIDRMETHAIAIGVALDRVLLTEELRRLDKARARFIANAAHELRTPLSTILGLSAALARNPLKLKEHQLVDGIEAVHRQAQRLRNLVSQLLDMSQIEQGAAKLELQEVRLLEAVEEVLEGAPAPTGKVVEREVPADLAVRADPTRLQQVITNLLTNAYRYGGDRIWVEARRDNGDVTLCVADNGPGVPMNLLDQLFDPFVRGDESRSVEGAGLGLAIVKNLVVAFDGKIHYESRPGGGAKFVIELAPAT